MAQRQPSPMWMREKDREGSLFLDGDRNGSLKKQFIRLMTYLSVVENVVVYWKNISMVDKHTH